MPYPVHIRGVLGALGDSVTVSGTLPLERIHLGDEVFVPTGDACFEVSLTYVGAGIVADGEVRSRMATICARCACDFEFDSVGHVDGFYVDRSRDAEIPEQQEREYIVDETVDLEPAIVQSLVVDLPFAPVHAPDCAGICPTCGADLNEVACGCEPATVASAFAPLQGLLRRGRGSDDDQGGPDGGA